GTPSLPAASFRRYRVSKLSVPSRITSKPATSSSTLRLSASATIPSTSTSEFVRSSLRSAATALGRFSAASASSKSICRWRFDASTRSEEHTSELQSRGHLVCRLLLEKKKKYIEQFA